jgi:hypothetical protein
MNEHEEKKLKAVAAIDFLYYHPAISPEIYNSDISDGVSFSLHPVCKNGYSDCSKSGVTVYSGSKLGEKFKEELEKECKEMGIIDPKDREIVSVQIPYEKAFGYPWAFDHVEFWWELTFFVFDGDTDNFVHSFDYNKWIRYSGDYILPDLPSCLSFEDMVIQIADAVKEMFGDFNKSEDFRNEGETETDKYGNLLPIHEGIINRRWLNWYIKKEGESKIAEEWGDGILAKWKHLIGKGG